MSERIIPIVAPSRGIFNRNDPVVDEQGILVRGGMWPSQRKWWELPNFVRLLVGGYGAGKTMLLCKRHIELALSHPAAPTAIVSPTYGMAKETTISTSHELLDGAGKLQRMWGGDLVYEYRKSSPYEFCITHFPVLGDGTTCKSTTGRLLIYSGEDPLKLKGPNLGSAGIDEPFIQEYEVFEQMVARTRHRKAPKIEINLTGTPESINNWGYDLAEGDLSSKYDIGIVRMSTTENKALNKGFVDRLLAQYDPKAAQAYVHGMFVNLAAGLVYYSFDRQENVVELIRPSGSELGSGMDFNVNPMCATVFWYVGGSNPHIHYFDEIELPNSDTQEMCHVLGERYWKQGLRNVYPDSNAGRATNQPAGKTDYTYIEQAGFVVNRNAGGNPHRRDRFNCVNGLLSPSGGRIRMTISPNCKKLIKYNSLYSHELMNSHAHKRMSHLLDARDYPAWALFPLSRYSQQLSIKGV